MSSVAFNKVCCNWLCACNTNIKAEGSGFDDRSFFSGDRLRFLRAAVKLKRCPHLNFIIPAGVYIRPAAEGALASGGAVIV